MSGAKRGAGAPDSLPARPLGVTVAVGVVALEALALLVLAGLFVWSATLPPPTDAPSSGQSLASSLLALAAMFGVLAIGLLAAAKSLWGLKRWARPASIAWQVLLILFAFSVLGSGWVLPAAAAAPAIVFLVAIFTPSALRAYDLGIAYHEAHPAAPAPPPKR